MILILDVGAGAQRILPIMRTIHRQVDCNKTLNFILNKLDLAWIDDNIINQVFENVELL